MSGSIRATKKIQRGRPATGTGEPVQVRIQPDLMISLDAWIAAQPQPKPSRPEAIRQLMTMSLGAMTAKATRKRMHS